MIRGYARAAAFLLLLAAAGCTAPQTRALLKEPGALPRQAELTAVPFYPQKKFYCGPAALAMTLTWSGLPVTQKDIAPQVYTPGRKGTLRSALVAAARRNGRLAVPVTGLPGLFAEVSAGNPVIVFQNLGLRTIPFWHYAVAVGYDLRAGTIILRSGTRRRRVTDLSTFERTWARGKYWALVVLPPGRLPATAGPLPVLRAAAGLERAGRKAEAATAYTAMARRWPANAAIQMGLGNARYALGDFKGSAAAFRRAAARAPRSADAWNNLAHVLGRLGRRRAAVAAARKAVRLGGPNAKTYLKTLREVGGRTS